MYEIIGMVLYEFYIIVKMKLNNFISPSIYKKIKEAKSYNEAIAILKTISSP